MRCAWQLTFHERTAAPKTTPGQAFGFASPATKGPTAQPRPTGASQGPRCDRGAVDAAAPWQHGGWPAGRSRSAVRCDGGDASATGVKQSAGMPAHTPKPKQRLLVSVGRTANHQG